MSPTLKRILAAVAALLLALGAGLVALVESTDTPDGEHASGDAPAPAGLPAAAPGP